MEKDSRKSVIFREASTDTNKTYTRDKITDAVQWGNKKSKLLMTHTLLYDDDRKEEFQ